MQSSLSSYLLPSWKVLIYDHTLICPLANIQSILRTFMSILFSSFWRPQSLYEDLDLWCGTLSNAVWNVRAHSSLHGDKARIFLERQEGAEWINIGISWWGSLSDPSCSRYKILIRNFKKCCMEGHCLSIVMTSQITIILFQAICQRLRKETGLSGTLG